MTPEIEAFSEAYKAAFPARLAMHGAPFSDAIPVKAILSVVQHAHRQGWATEVMSTDLDLSWVYRFTPPDWTPEKAALMAQIESEAA